MNLKYYLRGLGLGILVTALILGLSGNGEKTMTDAEIKERARELGMIENTVLTEQEGQESGSAAPLFEDLGETDQKTEENDQEPEEKAGETASEPEEKTGETAPEQLQAQGTEEIKKSEQSGGEAQTDEEVAAWPKEETEGAAEGSESGSAENDTEETGAPQTAQNGDQMIHTDGQTVILTIANGDSSYSVARKLFDMGVVSSVSEYDAYLCQNGYDRGIRAGTYEIKEGTTPEQIARMINGK